MTVGINKLKAIQKELPITRVVDFNNVPIEIKQYLPLELKMEIAEDIYKICANDINKKFEKSIDEEGNETDIEVETNNEYLVVNYTFKDVLTDILIIENYTDVKFTDKINFVDKYNLIDSIELNEFVKSYIPKREISELLNIIENKIEYERKKQEREKSLVGVVENFLVTLNDKIPSGENLMALVGNVGNQLKDFDPTKLEMISKVIGWNNGVDTSGNKVI